MSSCALTIDVGYLTGTPGTGRSVQVQFDSYGVLVGGSVTLIDPQVFPTSATGIVTVSVPWASSCTPNTVKVIITLDDGQAWKGLVPSLSSANLTDLITAGTFLTVQTTSPTQTQTVQGIPGMVWEGAWSSTANYLPTQVVSYAGSSWICLTANTNSVPSSGNANWSLVAQAATLVDATTNAVGAVLIDQAPTSGHPIALTAPRLAAASGVASLDSAAHVPLSQLSGITGSQLSGTAGIVSGQIASVAAASVTGRLVAGQLPTDAAYLDVAQTWTANQTIPTLYGSSAASGNLTLDSTSNATKGFIYLGGSSAYDGTNVRLGIGTTTPTQTLDVHGNVQLPSPAGGAYYLQWGDFNSSIHIDPSYNDMIFKATLGGGSKGFTFYDATTGKNIYINPSTGILQIPVGYAGGTSGSGVYVTAWDGAGGTPGTDLTVRGGNSQTANIYSGGNAGNLLLQTGKQTDNTNGLGGTRGYITFSTYTGGNTPTLTERMRVTPDGLVGIGTTTPTSALHVNGGVTTALATKTASYTVTTSDSVILVNAASTTVTLPAAGTAGAGRMYTVKNAGSGTSTTVNTGGGTIDGAATDTSLSAAYAVARYVSDGTNYYKV